MSSKLQIAIEHGVRILTIFGILCVLFVLAWIAYGIREMLETESPFAQSRLVKPTTEPYGPFDVEFPDQTAEQAAEIAQRRLGKSFYERACHYARNDEDVREIVGEVTEVRPAKGENCFYYPFTDGDGGGVTTLRITGDQGVVVVRVRGHGPECERPVLNMVAQKQYGSTSSSSPQK